MASLLSHNAAGTWPPARTSTFVTPDSAGPAAVLPTGTAIMQGEARSPGTAGFAGATSFVRPEDVAGSIPCGDSVDAVAEAAGAFFKAGFTDLALVQIGGTEPEQDRFLAAARELITALKETAG